jgi:hypothetical protein
MEVVDEQPAVLGRRDEAPEETLELVQWRRILPLPPLLSRRIDLEDLHRLTDRGRFPGLRWAFENEPGAHRA